MKVLGPKFKRYCYLTRILIRGSEIQTDSTQSELITHFMNANKVFFLYYAIILYVYYINIVYKEVILLPE